MNGNFDICKASIPGAWDKAQTRRIHYPEGEITELSRIITKEMVIISKKSGQCIGGI